jgi:hypothetical protein
VSRSGMGRRVRYTVVNKCKGVLKVSEKELSD